MFKHVLQIQNNYAMSQEVKQNSKGNRLRAKAQSIPTTNWKDICKKSKKKQCLFCRFEMSEGYPPPKKKKFIFGIILRGQKIRILSKKP